MWATVLCSVLAWFAPAAGSANAPKHQAPAKFPFSVEVDAASGRTGRYPNRFQDRRTGLWFVFVPGGNYRIGSDKRPDSKAIQVTLTGFYIAESRVTRAQRCQALLKGYQDGLNAMEDVLRKNPPGKYVEWRPLYDVAFLLVVSLASKDLVGEDLCDDIDAKLGPMLWGDAIRGDQRAFSRERRRVIDKLMARLEQRVAEAPKLWSTQVDSSPAPRRFGWDLLSAGLASETQRELAARPHVGDGMIGFGFSLPTDAQWEVAARLHAAKRIHLAGLFDGTLEPCADYYANDYFRRLKDFRDPKGPKKDKLDRRQQGRELGHGSSAGILNRLLAPARTVARGHDAVTRFYCPTTTPAIYATRVVYNYK